MNYNFCESICNVTEMAVKTVEESFNSLVKEYGITRIQFMCLYVLDNKGGISQKELAALMNIKESSTGRLIDRLEKEDLVLRNRVENDRRVFIVSLTKKGKRMIDKVFPIWTGWYNSLLEGIDEKDISVYIDILQKLKMNAENYSLGL